MATPIPPTRTPGHGPPSFNSYTQRPPESLADDMHNLQINNPPGQPPIMIPERATPPLSNPSVQFSAPVAPLSRSLLGASQPHPLIPPTGFSLASPPPPSFRGNSQLPYMPGGPIGQPFSERPVVPPMNMPVSGISNGPNLLCQRPVAPMNVPVAGISNGPGLLCQRPVNVGPCVPPPRASQPPVGPPLGGTFTGVPPAANCSPRALQAQSAPPHVVSAAPGLSGGASSQMPMSFPTGQSLQAPSFPGVAPPPPWQAARPGPPMAPRSMQLPTTYGSPSFRVNQHVPHIPPGMAILPTSGAPGSGSPNVDVNQIPRPEPRLSVTIFETRQNEKACLPPPASCDFIVKDSGNCSPRYMRCTVGEIPCSSDLAAMSCMPLALLVQPLALPHPSEEPIQVVDFGETGPIRCSRCKGYINPFMKFINNGKHFVCNLCGFANDTPRDYVCNLGPDGRRIDANDRPELCRGSVEFVAPKEYMVRDPMPAIFFFVVDVSMNAVKTGATAAACSAINQVISDLREGPGTRVGIATFDSTIHFYSLKRGLQQPMMLIVPDVQDVYTPLQSDIVVRLSECEEHLMQLLESIPSMFQNNRVAGSAFGAAIQAASLAMKTTGGRLLVFQSVLPSFGVGALSSREAEGRIATSSSDKDTHKLLQPFDETLKTMAIELAEYQVCVDVFLTCQSYVDIASISVIPRTTGGQVYYYYPFSALTDSAKLYNDLKWNLARPQGFDSIMRVRCSQGLQVQDYHGNFSITVPSDIDLPAIDCDKTIVATLQHDGKLEDEVECSFQCALLYTTVDGQRRIRVHTLSLPCTSEISRLFRVADIDALITCFLKQAANDIPKSPPNEVREKMTSFCVDILLAYRKYAATISSSGQLIFPEALKLLPVYMFALIKGSSGLRANGRIDERSYWASRVASLSASLAGPLVYPRMIAVHNLLLQDEGVPIIPYPLKLSCGDVADDGVYLLENGEDCLIYVGNMVDEKILLQIFGVPSVDGIPTQFVLKQFDNDLSKKLNDVTNEIRQKRCSYLRMRLCKKGEPSGAHFFSQMIEDKDSGHPSLSDFLIELHRLIQRKML